MERSEQINELATALAKAQTKIATAIKSSEANVQGRDGKQGYKFSYADLSAVSDACRPSLNENGIAIVQCAENAPAGTGVSVRTMLVHSSGQWIASTLTMTPGVTTPQAIGSAITYARRYGLAAICGVVQEDDDGAEASRPNPADARRQREVPKVPPAAGKGPTIADVQAAVCDWLGVQKDDANGVVKRIKAYLELPASPLTAENIPKVLDEIKRLREKGVDLNGLTDALAEVA